MHYLHSYLHFFSAILFFILGATIIVRNFKSRLNQACTGIMVCFFIWSFATTWVVHPATPERIARISGNFAAAGWIFFATFHLWFAWLYTKRKPFRFMKIIAALSFILPAVLLWLQWTRRILVASFEPRSYGWFTPWEPTYWPAFYFIYLTIMNLTSFGLIFYHGRKSDNIFIRKQSIIIFVTGLLSLVGGFLSNIILSLAIPEGSPPLGDVTTLLWAGGLAYGVIRYDMLNITPFIAANRIIAAMKDLLFLLDTHGRVISVNSAAHHALGCQLNQLTARYFGELIIDTMTQRNAITDTLLKQPEFKTEVVLSCIPGISIPVELSTSLIPGTGIVCVAHDISLQKQRTESLKEAKKQLESKVAQATEELRRINTRLVKEIEEKNRVVEALKESEERFRIIFEYAPDGIYLLDHDGTFIDGNNEALRITGYSKGEVTGRNLFKSGLLSRNDAKELAEMISSVRENVASGYQEFTLTRRDGSELPVETSAHLLKIGEKSLNVCIVRDLSQRKKTEKEAEELREALLHSQKMDAVGRLAGGIAHDFNNLLGGIIGYAGLLQKRLPEAFHQESEILGKIIDVSKQAADRTGQLLAFARKGQFSVEPVNMHTVINEVINLMRHTVDPKIVLTSRLDAPFAIVHGDRSQLHSALLNLGVNARDALPDGGYINFSTENVPAADVQVTDIYHEKNAERYLKIIVTDNGTGMDNATALRVFEPFFSTKEAGKGTGLGLPSVYGTIQQHEGYIALESEQHKGTSFFLYLPVLDTAELSQETRESCSDKTGGHYGKVLIVDDNSLLREMMAEALMCEGYTVHACENGNEALVWYRSNYAACDLVILDYAMPELNGRECFSAMKSIRPSIKAIITSGYAVDGEIEKTLKAGACLFLQKPFEVAELITTVQEVISQAEEAHGFGVS